MCRATTVDGIICAEAGSPAERIGFCPIDTSNIGLYGSAAWRALPGTIAPLPIADRAPYPNPVEEPVHTNFQQLKPGAAIYGLTTVGHGNGVVESTPITGRTAFRFGPQGVAYSFYQPWIRRCILDLRFSLFIPERIGTTICVELRDRRSKPYITGPSVTFGPSGGVVANGISLATVPMDKWVDVRVHYDYRLGSLCRNYRISLHIAGRKLAVQNISIPNGTGFGALTWLGFINQGRVGQESYLGYVDCAPVRQ